jgi:predicted pyridoxine 5'-phosphate oxidase superfamily flavin-nucleotide-binding protein
MSKSSEPFHEGERAVQRAAGEEEGARQNAPMIADAVMGGARPFLQTQRMLVVASRDGRERPWASLVFGEAGFVSAHDDGQTVTIDRTMAFANDDDILWKNLKLGVPLGLLAIELSTRRRLRINGRVESLTKERIVLRVEQAYPNCPKYIQRRRLRTATLRNTTGLPATKEGHSPDAALLEAVKKSDTIFVASGHPSRGLDASHRGGQPCFVKILLPGVLRIPDYAGNSMFNTLGNLRVDPRSGVTLLDFSQGRLYQMTGEANLHFDPPGGSDDLADTGRYWDFLVQDWRSTELPVQADWEFVDYSPYNPA